MIKGLLWVFLLLFGAFLVQYGFCAYGWVTPPPIAEITDREGERLSADETTVHLLGDPNGNVPKTMLAYYEEKVFSYQLLSGGYGGYRATRKAKLTLSASLQRAAQAALREYRGTVAVMNYETGELLCAVSTPSFAPDGKGEAAEGMFVNRFLQGLYTPGSIYKLVTLAATLEEMPDAQTQVFSCDGQQFFGGDKVTCPVPHGEQSLKDAFRNSCNCAFATLATELGEEKMTAYAEKFGLTASIAFDGFVTAKGRYDSAVSLPWSGVGQGDCKINPCAFLTFLSAVARDGQVVNPYLMASVSVGGRRVYKAKTTLGGKILLPQTAHILKDYLSYSAEKYFCDPPLCAKTGTAEVGAEKPNAMLCGFLKESDTPYAFLIIAENAGSGSAVCLPILQTLLRQSLPCVKGGGKNPFDF